MCFDHRCLALPYLRKKQMTGQCEFCREQTQFVANNCLHFLCPTCVSKNREFCNERNLDYLTHVSDDKFTYDRIVRLYCPACLTNKINVAMQRAGVVTRYSLEQMRDPKYLYDTVQMLQQYHIFWSWPIQEWAIDRETTLFTSFGGIRRDLDKVRLSCAERDTLDSIHSCRPNNAEILLACVAV